MEIKPYMEELPFPDNMNDKEELGFLDKNGNTVEIYIGSNGHQSYEEGILEWWVVSNWWDDKPLRPNQETEVKQFLNEYLKYHGVPEYEIIWRNRYDDEDGDESDVYITLEPLPAAEEKLWKSIWDNKRGNKSCSHEDLQIKTMELSNNELLLTIDCNACGKRISTSAPMESDAWEAEDLNTWAQQELSSHGQNVSFKNWAKKEVKSHGNIDLVDWAKHEKQSHTKKYGAEYENIGTMQSSPASGYNGYMNMMSSARRMVEIGNETGLDQKLGEAYQDESGRWFLPIFERKASESFSLDSKKADSINMEEPVIEEPSFIPDGDGRAIGQQNSSINLSPLHAESRQNSDYTESMMMDGSLKPYTIIVYRYRDGMREYEEQVVVRENLSGLDVLKQVQEMNKEDDGERITEGYVRGYLTDEEYKLGLKMNLAAESRFDNLSNEIADEYEEKGKTPEEAERIGDATAAMIGRKKYGKKGMAQMSKKGMDAESEEYFDCGCVYEVMMEGAMCESCGHTTCSDCSQNINTTDANYKNWKCYEGYGCNSKRGRKDAESDSATYSPSSNPDMVNEIQTSPTNESPQLFNASNTFKATTALGIGGLVVAALSLPMLYSSAKSRLGKSAEEKRKASGSVRKNHTQIKNSEYSVGQVNPVEAEGQQDIHGAEGITNPRHAPSASPAGYPSKTLKMW